MERMNFRRSRKYFVPQWVGHKVKGIDLVEPVPQRKEDQVRYDAIHSASVCSFLSFYCNNVCYSYNSWPQLYIFPFVLRSR